MNVLMLGNVPPPYGGVAVHVEGLCQHLSKTDKVYLLADRPLDRAKSSIRNGYKVYRPLVTVADADTPIGIKDVFQTILLNAKEYHFGCIKIWSTYLLQFPLFVHYGIRTDIEMLYALPLYEILKKQDIDLIHAHHASDRAFRALWLSTLMRKKVPLVVTMHRGEFESQNKKSINLVKVILRKANKLVAVSNLVKQTAIDFGALASKVVVIPNGVNTSLFRPIELRGLKDKYGIDHDKIILFVGGLTEKKGIIDLVLSFKRIDSKKALLFVVGDGPLKKRLFDLCLSLKLQNQVTFLGIIPHRELVEVYNLADIFVLPSYVEGLSCSLLEAMSCGKPVITSHQYPLRHDAVTHEFNGLLIQAGDLNALSSSLYLLINDEKLRKKLGHNARKTILDRFDWSIIANQVRKLYEETV